MGGDRAPPSFGRWGDLHLSLRLSRRSEGERGGRRGAHLDGDLGAEDELAGAEPRPGAAPALRRGRAPRQEPGGLLEGLSPRGLGVAPGGGEGLAQELAGERLGRVRGRGAPHAGGGRPHRDPLHWGRRRHGDDDDDDELEPRGFPRRLPRVFVWESSTVPSRAGPGEPPGVAPGKA